MAEHVAYSYMMIQVYSHARIERFRSRGAENDSFLVAPYSNSASLGLYGVTCRFFKGCPSSKPKYDSFMQGRYNYTLLGIRKPTKRYFSPLHLPTRVTKKRDNKTAV